MSDQTRHKGCSVVADLLFGTKLNSVEVRKWAVAVDEAAP